MSDDFKTGKARGSCMQRALAISAKCFQENQIKYLYSVKQSSLSIYSVHKLIIEDNMEVL